MAPHYICQENFSSPRILSLSLIPQIMSLNSKVICKVSVQHHLEQYNETLAYLMHCLQLHVFVRNDAVRKPLQTPYEGPYPVLERTDKFFKLNINGTVSIDRLKPAYTDSDTHLNTPPQSQTYPHPTTTTRVTRSGRRVHWPNSIVTPESMTQLSG